MWPFGPSVWLHLAAAVLFAFGLVLTFRRETTAVRGIGTLVRFGSVFFAVPLAVFGMQHFALFDTVKFAVPAYMPGRFFWAYLVGAALIAACLSILTEIRAELAALLVGIMLFLFVLMIYVPNLIQNPGDRFAITVPLRDLALSGGALSPRAFWGLCAMDHQPAGCWKWDGGFSRCRCSILALSTFCTQRSLRGCRFRCSRRPGFRPCGLGIRYRNRAGGLRFRHPC